MNRSPALAGLSPVSADSLSEFGAAFEAQQQATRRLWVLAGRLWEGAGEQSREFVADELAVVMRCHPTTAQQFLAEANLARALPALFLHWAPRQLTDRHVKAALSELHACLGAHEHRVVVLDRVLDKCRRRVCEGRAWPTPGELRRMIRVAALLVDPEGAEQRKQEAAERRGLHASALPDGQAMLALEGPQERIAVILESVRARAAAAARKPGETRTREQLEFDVAEELLLAGMVEHGDDDDGQVRFDVQVVVPIDTAGGDADQLGELPGLGPVLPSTCRELLARAGTLTRVCTDAVTGRVLAVDDPVRVDRDPDAITTALAAMRTAPLLLPNLSTHRYRPSAKALRFVKTRDRTCRFPGCTRPARSSDVDHELPWPLGTTDPQNLHCLCRHHHRAKQSGLFSVHTEPDGATAWTLTRSGQVVRRPPPAILPTL